MPGTPRSGARQDLATEVTEITEGGGLVFLLCALCALCGSIRILVCRAYRSRLRKAGSPPTNANDPDRTGHFDSQFSEDS